MTAMLFNDLVVNDTAEAADIFLGDAAWSDAHTGITRLGLQRGIFMPHRNPDDPNRITTGS
jgi:hypothetical protein